MPTKLCLEPTCPDLATYRGRCRAHAAKQERTRSKAGRKVYASKKWTMTRRRYLLDHPLCECGCGELATDVHHKQDIEAGGAPYSMTNLEALAHDCHSRTTRERQLAGVGEGDR